MYKLSQIAEITNIRFEGALDHAVSFFLNDSRTLQSAGDTLFVALKTGRNNGHNYIEGLIKQHVKSFLVMEGEFDTAPYKGTDISFLISPDPLKTLQELASWHRQQFSIPVIGITGSNGKTVVKEWLYQLLKTRYTICRSPKSYNSQVGVPLSVLNLADQHTLGIFEAGISLPGEMDRLASIIRPTIGILTSLGSAHDEGFESRDQKLNEKLKLVAGSDLLILNGVSSSQAKAITAAKVLAISQEPDNGGFTYNFENGILNLQSHSGAYRFAIPFSDAASVSNCATCAVVLLQLGLSQEFISSGLKALQPVALRLEIKNGIRNSLIINDYYNSDLDSFRIALTYLQQQNRRQRKIVVLSDIEQSGVSPALLYRELADLLSRHKIDLVVGIGPGVGSYRHLFRSGSLFFAGTADFVSQFAKHDYQFADAGILLKGARSFGFEDISRLLQLKSHDTVFEIDLNKLTDNVNYYRSLIGTRVRLMCMVKAMGYGSGGAEIARTLQHIGVDYLAVAYADEGVELRQSRVALPIMVMNPEEDALVDIVSHRLEPELYTFRVLERFAACLDAMGITEPYPVHIKIDTGMHRLGFEAHEIEALCERLATIPNIKVRSVFSHLAASDNPQLDDFTHRQLQAFEAAFQRLEEKLGYKVLKHICNSSAITRHPGAHYDMVRLGIGMYGIGVNEAEQTKLQNVGSLKTRISQVKALQAGETVSYNRSGKIERPTRVATLPIGYADGFSRTLGNGNHGVYINGNFCKTIGSVCMDMCMVDVTGLDCREGDEALIFENVEQIKKMATALHSIPYEVLTNVSGRVKRIYVQE